MSAKDALLSYYERQLKKTKNGRTRKRRNAKPEEVAVKEILSWCDKNNWSVHRVESKAVYSAAAGRYLRGQAVPGFTDLVGNTDTGQAVFIEVKARGKRATIKPHQTEFIRDKIRTGCFAMCADTADYLGNNWVVYSALSTELGKKYLSDLLPKSRS